MKGYIRITACAYAILSIWTAGVGSARENRFSTEVEAVLQQKIQLTKSLAEDPQIVALVKESNEKNKKLTLREIYKLDEKWQTTEGIDQFIGSFISNECAEHLISFQKRHDGFAEIFIADAVGLIVGETNKTSDYYQADEAWWHKGYNKGLGKSYYGDIEYDESARVEAITLYVPVIDPQSQHAIGVVKAVYKIANIIAEL